MFIKPALYALLNLALGGAFVYFGIVTFGMPLEFDRLFFLSLFFVAFICRKDLNALSVVAIVVICRLIDETGYNLLKEADLLTRLFGYPLVLYALYRTRGTVLTWPSYITLGVVVVAEVYWYLTDYQSPFILFYAFEMALNALFVFLIDMRVFYLIKLFPGKVKALTLDVIVRFTGLIMVLANIAMLLEYVLRHTGVTSSTNIYYAYPVIAHVVSVCLVWFLFYLNSSLRLQNILKA